MTATRAARLFRALSDPIRLRTLFLLEDGEACVGDLVSTLDVPQPTASRHLRYLRRAGLVACRKIGRWCFYSRARGRTQFERSAVECAMRGVRGTPAARADAARLRRLRSSGGCCAPEVPA